MKFVCPACDRLADLHTFRLDAGVLFVKCDRCGLESKTDAVPAQATGTDEGRSPPAPTASVVPLRVVSAAAPRAGEDPFEPPENTCPKCISPRNPEAFACAACGLVFVNFHPADSQPAPALAERWKALIPRWSDALAHDEVVKSAAVTGQLPQLGRLYRIQLARRPDDPLARRGRDEVIRLASAASALAGARDELRAPLSLSIQKAVLYVGGAMVALLAMMLIWSLAR